MARVRVRQHVNPLSHKYSTPIDPPDWQKVYQNIDLPLHLDIGCARGKFLLDMALQYREINFLGIEIRQALVLEANQDRDRLGLSNLHFLFCNINVSLENLLKSLPEKKLQWVTIQFPDPWFKQRHSKRRMVQPELVNLLSIYLSEGGIVFLQSDVQEVALDMTEKFRENTNFSQQHETIWLEENIFPVATAREIMTKNKGEPVYRSLFKLQNHAHFIAL